MKHTRRQIEEAIRYWEGQLCQIDESTSHRCFRNCRFQTTRLFSKELSRQLNESISKLDEFEEENKEELEIADKVVETAKNDNTKVKKFVKANAHKVEEAKKKMSKEDAGMFQKAWDFLVNAASRSLSWIADHIVDILKIIAVVTIGFLSYGLYKRFSSALNEFFTGKNAVLDKATKDKTIARIDTQTKQLKDCEDLMQKMIEDGSLTEDQKSLLLSFANRNGEQESDIAELSQTRRIQNPADAIAAALHPSTKGHEDINGIEARSKSLPIPANEKERISRLLQAGKKDEILAVAQAWKKAGSPMDFHGVYAPKNELTFSLPHAFNGKADSVYAFSFNPAHERWDNDSYAAKMVKKYGGSK